MNQREKILTGSVGTMVVLGILYIVVSRFYLVPCP